MNFDQLEPEYKANLAAANPTRSSEAIAVAKRLLMHRDRFLALQSISGVPALWVMPVFERENPSFDTYLGNGQSLHRPTTLVPKNRGPFSNWEAGAADALKLDHITDVSEWSWQRACYQWELWNGFGPRNHGHPSGYVWSGTTIYQGGKYIADGVWSRGTWDAQLGCVIIARAIAELDDEIGKGFSMVTPAPVVVENKPCDSFIAEIKKLIAQWEISV
jgi:lysozyme family protein